MHKTLRQTIDDVTSVDDTWITAARHKQENLTKPSGSLGELEHIAGRISAITQSLSPTIQHKRIYVVAGDHGVSAEGVSAYPSEVTAQMVNNFLCGGAAINVLARHGDIELRVVDAGVAADFPEVEGLIARKIVRGTANFTYGPAMTRENAETTIITGIEIALSAKDDGIQLLGFGEMGIGNTTSASAVTAALMNRPIDEVTGIGTGIDDERLAHKISVIDAGLRANRPKQDDPVGILSAVGGVELGVMTGIVLGSASIRLPIVCDGFIATASAALAVALCPAVRDYLFLAHLSPEPGHRVLTDYVGHKPILNLRMRLGEGTGVALAMHIIEAASKLLSEMSTFDDAGVSKKGTNLQGQKRKASC